jgi:hypothetical protein
MSVASVLERHGNVRDVSEVTIRERLEYEVPEEDMVHVDEYLKDVVNGVQGDKNFFAMDILTYLHILDSRSPIIKNYFDSLVHLANAIRLKHVKSENSPELGVLAGFSGLKILGGEINDVGFDNAEKKLRNELNAEDAGKKDLSQELMQLAIVKGQKVNLPDDFFAKLTPKDNLYPLLSAAQLRIATSRLPDGFNYDDHRAKIVESFWDLRSNRYSNVFDLLKLHAVNKVLKAESVDFSNGDLRIFMKSPIQFPLVPSPIPEIRRFDS